MPGAIKDQNHTILKADFGGELEDFRGRNVRGINDLLA